jgi:glucose/arabinose dehydrogenase
MTTTEGKVLRIDPEDLPADPLTAIFARGFRNPFSLASDGAVVYVNDVGEEAWEEVNVLAQGANYGWPQCEGPCSVAGMTNPLHAYASTGLSAITGGAFYDGPLQGMSGHYFVGDWGQSRVRRLNDATSFPAFDVSGPVDVAMKGGELYVLTQGGTLYRAVVQ